MMGRLAGAVIDWYGGRRRRQLEEIWRDPAGVQERALQRLIATARDTEFGLEHGFRGIGSVAEYQTRVPVRDYGQMRPWLQRAAAGEESVAWRGRCRDWVKTSGTTAGDKVIPVTPEALASHQKGAGTAAAGREPGRAARPDRGPMLFLGQHVSAQSEREPGRATSRDWSRPSALGLPRPHTRRAQSARRFRTGGALDASRPGVDADVRLLGDALLAVILFERIAATRRRALAAGCAAWAALPHLRF